jgi:hypothetical protein
MTTWKAFATTAIGVCLLMQGAAFHYIEPFASKQMIP